MAKYKHLTLDERYKIQEGLNNARSLRSIARQTGKDCTTISKEIRRHLELKQTGCFGRTFNDCAKRKACKRELVCTASNCNKKCSNCNQCYKSCSLYEKQVCKKLTKAPFVCNACASKGRCSLEKRMYSAQVAHKQYKEASKERRRGLCVSEEEIASLDELISPLLKKGHSIHHICASNPDKIMFSERTIYNYVDCGLFTARNVDMPRKVRFRPRKSAHDNFKIDKACRIGRTLKDYEDFLLRNPDTAVVQMDSVIGNVGGKLLLTIHFVKTEYMLAFLRERNTAASVSDVFNGLYESLGHDRFTKLFPVILCDNGSEFSNPTAIEVDEDGVIRTKIFYCDPSSPYQKGAVENNHEFIRRIIPKGMSMNDLTQDKVDLMMSHINSYKRENLGDKSPYEVFKFFYGRDILDVLGIKEVPANDIILRPSLLR